MTISPKTDAKNKSSTSNTPDISQVASMIKSWRAAKKSTTDPMPMQTKSSVYQLICHEQYSLSILSKNLHLTLAQLKSIKAQFSDDKLIKQHKNKPSKYLATPDIKPNPEMLPFKLVPHDVDNCNQFVAPNSLKNNSLNHNFHQTNDRHNHTTGNIIIGKSDGSNLELPSHLHSSLVINIINSFLCSK